MINPWRLYYASDLHWVVPFYQEWESTESKSQPCPGEMSPSRKGPVHFPQLLRTYWCPHLEITVTLRFIPNIYPSRSFFRESSDLHKFSWEKEITCWHFWKLSIIFEPSRGRVNLILRQWNYIRSRCGVFLTETFFDNGVSNSRNSQSWAVY